MNAAISARSSSSEPYSNGFEGSSTTRCTRRLFWGLNGTRISPAASTDSISSHSSPFPTTKPVAPSLSRYTSSTTRPSGSTAPAQYLFRFSSGISTKRKEPEELKPRPTEANKKVSDPAAFADLFREMDDDRLRDDRGDLFGPLEALLASPEAHEDLPHAAQERHPFLLEGAAGTRG